MNGIAPANLPSSRSASRTSQGFTVVELVVVIVILGVLAITGMSRFSSANVALERGFHDQVLSALHYAHRLASAGGCDLRVQMGGGQFTLSQWSSCSPASHSGSTTAIPHPDNTGSFSLTIPNGVATGTLDIYFNGAGQPHSTATDNPLNAVTTLAVGSRSINIQPTTGFAHE